MSLQDTIKLAIIGMGNMGCQYAQMVTDGRVQGFELAAVTRIKPEKKEALKDVFTKDIPIYQSADELFADIREEKLALDAVIIATPHREHAKQVIEAMQLGLHVLCDKPSGICSREARKMQEEAARHKELVFAMMFNQRMNPLYQKMKEMVEKEIYGKLKRVNWVMTDWYRPDAYYDSVSWRGTWELDGGGILLNQCPHNLDLLQWICGMPERVQAFCHEGKYHQIEVEDEVTAYMEFANGATGMFYATTGEAPGMNRLELSFEDALLVCECGELRVCELGFHEPDYRRTATEQFAKLEGTWKKLSYEGENLQHVGILRNFEAAVRKREPLFVEGKEGRKSLLLSNIMYLSSWQKKMIELPQTVEEEKKLEKAFEVEYMRKKDSKNCPH